MITIFIDNEPRQVKPDQNLLQACLALGLDLPYFCWHPALHAVGACRQCAVKQFKDEHDARGKIIMACMTPVAEGMRISVDDPEARAFRAGVIEWLMLNHPHDCPVCDEGGECHLQDMTVMTGHALRRTRFPKRTHRNQDLGPFLNHEMNRCIQCYRCVRFYRGVAGGRDLNVFGAHDHVYFGRHEDGALENEFSGNLVEICPTGVFTDKTFKQHFTRKWDLQTAPSVCVHCGVGCNTIIGERYGSLRRVLNRYHGEVNGYFLCDRGRFGYEFVNSGQRVRDPLLRSASPGDDIRSEGQHRETGETAIARIASMLSEATGIIGIGSPRASLESNFALRSLVGNDHFHTGMADREHRLVSLIIDILRNGPARTPSLREVQQADAVLVLGEDVANTAPLLALALRQSVRQMAFDIAQKRKIPAWADAAVRNVAQDAKNPLFVATPYATRLDDAASRTWRAAPADIALLAYAIAHAIDPAAPQADMLSTEGFAFAREIAAALQNAERPLIVCGTGCRSEAVAQAAANIAWTLCGSGKSAALCFAVPECNTMGVGLMGGRTLDEAFTRMRDGLADTVIVLENDLYRRADAAEVDAFLGRAKQVIVLDHVRNPTVLKADVVLPAATFAEATGTYVNNEGRAQRAFPVIAPGDAVPAGWKWIDGIMSAPGRTPNGPVRPTPDSIIRDLARMIPLFAPATDLVPSGGSGLPGQKVPRQSHRFSGRTAMSAHRSVHEDKPPEDPDSPLAFSMEGASGDPPAPLIARYWAPGWNSVQALNRFQQEAGGPLRGGDPGRRLIEPAEQRQASFFAAAPLGTGSADEEPAPRYHIFGSEELSALAPGIVRRRKAGP